jgi:hypothetical protein
MAEKVVSRLVGTDKISIDDIGRHHSALRQRAALLHTCLGRKKPGRL